VIDISWSLGLWLAGWTVGLMLAYAVIRERRPPAATMAWLVFVLALPFVGVVVYLLIGTRKRSRKERARLRTPVDYAAVDADERLALSGFLAGLGQAGPSANRVAAHAEAGAARRALLALIDGAEREVNFVVYTFERDDAGREVLRALRRACERGVTVRLLVDDLGSWDLGRTHMDKLERSGGRVGRFKPLWYALRARTVNLRNHRKIVVADGARAWTGCRNIGDPYLADHAEQTRWADLSYVIEGPAAAVLDEICRCDWQFATGEALPPPKAVGLDAMDAAASAGAESRVQVIASGPDQRDDPWHAALLKALMAARRRVWIATPYFVPDEAVQHALAIAARSGVDVRLLIPKRSDSRMVDWVARTYLRDLARVGVKVLRFEPGMMHAKLMLVDDAIVTGSANMDARSFFLNYEVVLHVDGDAALLGELEAWYARLEARSLPGVRRYAIWRETLADLARLLAPMM
jgi:cardiolipin synthase